MNLARALTTNMAVLTVGKVLTIVMSLVMMILLTRGLEPTGFGFYRSVVAYLGLAGIFSYLGLHLIFVREFSRDEADQPALLGQALGLRLASAAVLLIGAAGLAWLFPYEPVVRWGILLSVPGFIALAAHQLLTGVFQEKLRQGPPVAAEVAGGMLTLALVLGLLQAGAGVVPVLLAFVAGNLLTLAISWRWAFRIVPFRLGADIAVWRTLLVPALPIAAAQILQQAYYKTDIIALSLLQPAAEVGLYSVGRQILDTFVGFALMYTGLVMPLLSRAAGKDPAAFASHLRNGFDTLAVGAIGAAMVSVAFAQPIAALIGGSAFAAAGPALMALAPLIALYPLCLVCRFAVTALDRQAELLRGYAVAAVLGVASYFVLIPWFGAIGAGIGLLIGELTVFVVALRVLRRAADVGPSWGILARAAACAALAFLAVRLPLLRDLPWVLGLGAAGLVYLVLLLLVGAIPPHLLATILSASDSASPERAARADHAAAVVARRDLGRAMREVKLIDLLGVLDRNHVVSHLMRHDRWARLLERYVGWSPQQLLVYLAGCLLFSLGVKLFIDADLGVDPLNSMVIGMVQALDVSWVRIGFVTSIVTILFLAVWSLWNRRWPPFSTFVTMALVGYLVDLWNLLALERWTTAWLNPLPMLLLAFLVFC
jgi:O-antigen/teichoic acid export membrane protein